MAADDKLAEAISRVEHKVDLLLVLVAKTLPLNPANQKFLEELLKYAQVGSSQHKCPLCSQPVEYIVDSIDAIVVRKCGCKTGKIALDLKAFAPPALPVPKKENENEQQPEDRGHSTHRGGFKR
jgi:hypothetical protein